MYSVGDGGAMLIACEALINTVVLTSWLIVRQDQSPSAYHLLDAESIHDQWLIVLRPSIPGDHTRRKFVGHPRCK